MDLTIQRLKVLGEAELARIDTVISEYKSRNDPTILDRDINQIRIQLQDMQTMHADLVKEYSSKQGTLTSLKKSVSDINQKYEELESNIATLETQISQAKECINANPAKLEELNMHITTLSAELNDKEADVAKCMQELADTEANYELAKTRAGSRHGRLSIALNAIDLTIKHMQELTNITYKAEDHAGSLAEYDKLKQELEEQMKQIKLAIQEHISTKFQEFAEFADGMKQIIRSPIVIEPKLSQVEVVFSEILGELTKIMSRNYENYGIVRTWYKDTLTSHNRGIYYNKYIYNYGTYTVWYKHVEPPHYIGGVSPYTSYIATGGEYQLDPVVQIHGFVCTNLTHSVNTDCIPNSDKEVGMANSLLYYYYQCSPHVCSECKFTNFGYTLKIDPYNEWLRAHYKAIFSHIIKNDQLNYIIQNTETYTDLHKHFAESGAFPMSSYNEFEFMLMLAFLGNNGKPHNLYDDIILNPDCQMNKTESNTNL